MIQAPPSNLFFHDAASMGCGSCQTRGHDADAMVPPDRRPAHRVWDARRGVTLIEAVLYIAVALGLIVGGLVFYQQASRAATYQSVVRGLQVVQGEVQAMYQVTSWQNSVQTGPTRITAALIAMGAVPAEMMTDDGQQIRLTRDSQLLVWHGLVDGEFQTLYQIQAVPEWMCTKMVVASTATGSAASSGNGTLGDGILFDIASVQVGGVGPEDGFGRSGHIHHFRQVALEQNETSGDLTPALAAQICRERASFTASRLVSNIVFATIPMN
ncbi:hypothetical protein [uncultured Roseicyclus sp.]|uniref:hypothetical protein n=1 Tax=uncultured Roseicyclus sp. TaxID=543072 RepID=UPI00263882C7|nr:hypothetical protein [uncultured Roseicyclus sp.]